MDFLVQKQWHVTGIDLTLSSTMFEYFLSAFLRGYLYCLDKGSSFEIMCMDWKTSFHFKETLFISFKWYIDKVLIDMDLNQSSVKHHIGPSVKSVTEII